MHPEADLAQTMDTLRIALAQINPTVGDLDGNVARIAETIQAAREQHADLVTVPELSLSGYPPEDLLLKPRASSATAAMHSPSWRARPPGSRPWSGSPRPASPASTTPRPSSTTAG